MVFWIKHKFQSAKADGTDVTLVKPSNWNDEHEMYMDEGTIIGRPPGSGAGPPMEIPIGSLTPTGMVMPFAGNVEPPGWFFCNGRVLNRAEYATLFAVIGGIYGAPDASTFNIPDLRGRVIAGVDAGAGRLGTIIGGTIGAAGGQEAVQYYADVSVWGSARGYGATGGEALSAHVWGQSNDAYGGMGTVGGGPAVGTHSHYNDIWGNTGGTHSAWTDTAMTSNGGGYTRNASNMQPTLVMNYLIKA